MDSLTFEDDQAAAAAGAFLVIGGMGVRGGSVNVAKGGEMGLEDKAVSQPDLADRKWRQQQRELVVARGGPAVRGIGGVSRTVWLLLRSFLLITEYVSDYLQT
jgi:predicted TIM-barrel enzyme